MLFSQATRWPVPHPFDQLRANGLSDACLLSSGVSRDCCGYGQASDNP